MRGDIQVAPGVEANWQVNGGMPCIAGTRITTAWAAARFSYGSPVEALAQDWGIDAMSIEAAIRYEYRRRRNRQPEFRAAKSERK
jgi:uncharacterized protein (DUF433 family)